MVERTGELGTIQVVRGLPKLTEEAERSVRQWKFEPAKLNGERVAASVLAAFSLNLSLPSPPEPDHRPPTRKTTLPYEPIRITATAPARNPAADVAFGTVTLQVVVDPTGSVSAVEVIDGIRPLAHEAERSVREWRFRPANFDGAPLASSMVVSFIFSDLPPAQCSRF
jgi:TonB family protein